MTPRPPPSAEHFTQVVTEVDRLVQQGCAEISAVSRMALLWLETPETSNRLEVLASALRTIRNSADMLASETRGEVVAVGCSHYVKSSAAPLNRAQRSEGPHQLPVCQRLRRATCGVAVLPKDRTASSTDSPQLPGHASPAGATPVAMPQSAPAPCHGAGA